MTLCRAVCTAVASCVVAAVAAEPRDPWAQQTSGTARVQGRVIAADTGAVVRGAMVSCTAPSSAALAAATTDDEGRFECRELPAAIAITVRVVKAGFVAATVGLPAPLRDGQIFNQGDIRVIRGAVIAGRVLDATGEPLADAIVNAWRIGYPQPGNRRMVSARSGPTNDLGEYRLYGLTPGTYYVSAAADRVVMSEFVQVSSSSSVQLAALVAPSAGSAATFYPGTASASEAQAIAVRGGDQALGIDLRLLSNPQASVSGHVIDSRGQPRANARVRMRSVASAGFMAEVNALTDAAGRFTLVHPGPGEYQLTVIGGAISAGPSVAVPGGQVATQIIRSDSPETASMPITVGAGSQPIADLLIQTRLGNELRGRVILDGAIPAAAATGRFGLTTSPVDPDGHFSPTMSIGMASADGAFVLSGLMGRVRLVTTGAPTGSTLLRIIANGLDVTDEGVDMDRGNVAGVEVHLTTRPTLVKGQVTDAEGKPAVGTVIVYSENPALWSKPNTRYVVSRSSSLDTGFRIPELPAGRYLAVAVEQVVPDQWADPENLLRLRPQATPFTVVEGETMTLALRRR